MVDHQRITQLVAEAMPRRITPSVRSRLLTLLVTLAAEDNFFVKSEKKDHNSKDEILKMFRVSAEQLGRQLDKQLSRIDSRFWGHKRDLERKLSPREISSAVRALARKKNIDLPEAERRVRQKRSSSNKKKIKALDQRHRRERAPIASQRAEVKKLQQRWNPIVIEYKCPKCNQTIKRKLVSSESKRQVNVRLMKYHWKAHHKMDWNSAYRWITDNRNKTKPADDEMANHVSGLLPFEILPPAESTLEKTIEQYKKHEKAIVKEWGRSIDYSRITNIFKLEPDLRYWGTEGFLGYSVYEFSRFGKVVLDCPIEGNALYLLYKNRWKHQSGLTKKEIRENFPGEYRKIVHKGSWLYRVSEELQRENF